MIAKRDFEEECSGPACIGFENYAPDPVCASYDSSRPISIVFIASYLDKIDFVWMLFAEFLEEK